MPKSHAMPIDRGMREDEKGKIVNSEIAKEAFHRHIKNHDP